MAFTMRAIVFGTISTFQGAFLNEKPQNCEPKNIVPIVAYEKTIYGFLVEWNKARNNGSEAPTAELAAWCMRKCKLHGNCARTIIPEQYYSIWWLGPHGLHNLPHGSLSNPLPRISHTYLLIMLMVLIRRAWSGHHAATIATMFTYQIRFFFLVRN